MKRVALYIYKDAVGPKKQGAEWGYRLIADEGYKLSDGTTECDCIDIKTGDEDNWQEIETAQAEIEDYEKALAKLGVNEDDD